MRLPRNYSLLNNGINYAIREQNSPKEVKRKKTQLHIQKGHAKGSYEHKRIIDELSKK